MATQILPKPAVGSVWKHKNGNTYTVIGYTNERSDRPDEYPVTVIYKGQNDEVWSRKLSDWHRSFTWLKNLSYLNTLKVIQLTGADWADACAPYKKEVEQ